MIRAVSRKRRDWSLVSSQGSVLFFVACNPACGIDDIAEGLAVTSRTAWSLVGDLRRAGMLRVDKCGRRNCYSINPEAPFLHPTIGGLSLRMILAGLMDDGNGGNGLQERGRITSITYPDGFAAKKETETAPVPGSLP